MLNVLSPSHVDFVLIKSAHGCEQQADGKCALDGRKKLTPFQFRARQRIHYDNCILKSFGLSHEAIVSRVKTYLREMRWQNEATKQDVQDIVMTHAARMNYVQEVTRNTSVLRVFKGKSLLRTQFAMVRHESYRILTFVFSGAQACPICEKSEFEQQGCVPMQSLVAVRNNITNEEILFTSLSFHLLEEHGCFGRDQNCTRMHPRKWIRVLFDR
jgi:hypothetical protein